MLVVRGGTAKSEERIEEAIRRARGYMTEGESPSRAAQKAARESGHPRSEIYERLVKG